MSTSPLKGNISMISWLNCRLYTFYRRTYWTLNTVFKAGIGEWIETGHGPPLLSTECTLQIFNVHSRDLLPVCVLTLLKTWIDCSGHQATLRSYVNMHINLAELYRCIKTIHRPLFLLSLKGAPDITQSAAVKWWNRELMYIQHLV